LLDDNIRIDDWLDIYALLPMSRGRLGMLSKFNASDRVSPRIEASAFASIIFIAISALDFKFANSRLARAGGSPKSRRQSHLLHYHLVYIPSSRISAAKMHAQTAAK